ncbi:unnamed protein product [Blepharisma stoltei]|uniref:Photosystem I assembly protein Ycf4 n=1 Tax=Blepharisma stoltei TaxID=1481888 RepID=A0AAU9JQN7_9CILI|nr:unnamed protein product [Blepharisma stoltei]
MISTYKKPFNYDRASMWYSIFLTCSLLFWICCGISKWSKAAALIILLAGWAILGLFGIFFQKKYLPCLLISEKDKNIFNLFRFQLSSTRIEDAGIGRHAEYAYIKSDKNEKDEENPENSKFIR